jgi:senataxin
MPRLFEELTDVERTHAYCGDADVARIAYDALERELANDATLVANARDLDVAKRRVDRATRRGRVDEGQNARVVSVNCTSTCERCLDGFLELRRDARDARGGVESTGDEEATQNERLRFDFERVERGFDCEGTSDRIETEFLRECARGNALREILTAPAPARGRAIYEAAARAFAETCEKAKAGGDEWATSLMREIRERPCGSFPGLFALLAIDDRKTRQSVKELLSEPETDENGEPVMDADTGLPQTRMRALTSDNALRDVVDEVLAFWIECLARAQVERESARRTLCEEIRDDVPKDHEPFVPVEARLWFALAYTLERSDSQIAREVFTTHPIVFRLAACAMKRSNEKGARALSSNACEVIQVILKALPRGPKAAKSFWERVGVDRADLIEDLFQAALNLPKDRKAEQICALTALKYVYLLLPTGDAVQARQVMNILAADIPHSKATFSAEVQWASRLAACRAVEEQYSEIGVDDAVLTLGDWFSTVGMDWTKSVATDRDLSREATKARNALGGSLVDTIGYVICADAIALSALADPAFFAFEPERWAREKRIRGETPLGELHLKILNTIRQKKRWKINTSMWKYALGFDSMSAINSMHAGVLRPRYVSAVMYAMGLIAPFARNDDESENDAMRGIFPYAEIVPENQENANSLRKFLGKCGEWFFKSLLDCPESQSSKRPLDRSEYTPKCTEGAVMCMMSQRTSLVAAAGEVLKKHYAEDNRENCYKKMFLDDEHTDIPKAVLGATHCALKDVKRMPSETSEDVSELLKAASAPIVQTHHLVKAIDKDDKARLRTFSENVTKVLISSIGVFETITQHAPRRALAADDDILYSMLSMLTMYWKLIKAREQEHIFNRQPANILRNLLAWEPASFIGSAEEGIADAWLDCIGLFNTEVSDEPSSPGVSIRDESDWRQRVRELLSMRGDAALSDNIKEKLKSVFSMVSLFIEGEKENIGDVVVIDEPLPETSSPYRISAAVPTTALDSDEEFGVTPYEEDDEPTSNDPQWLRPTDQKKTRPKRKATKELFASVKRKSNEDVSPSSTKGDAAKSSAFKMRKREPTTKTYNLDRRKTVASIELSETAVTRGRVSTTTSGYQVAKAKDYHAINQQQRRISKETTTAVMEVPPPSATSKKSKQRVSTSNASLTRVKKHMTVLPAVNSAERAPALVPVSNVSRQFKPSSSRRSPYRVETLIRSILCLNKEQFKSDTVRARHGDVTLHEKDSHLSRESPPRSFANAHEYREHFIPLILAELRANVDRALQTCDRLYSDDFTVSKLRQEDVANSTSVFETFELSKPLASQANSDNARSVFKTDDLVMIETISYAFEQRNMDLLEDDDPLSPVKERATHCVFGWVESAKKDASNETVVIRMHFAPNSGVRITSMSRKLHTMKTRLKVTRVFELATTLRELQALDVSEHFLSRINNKVLQLSSLFDTLDDADQYIAAPALSAVESSLNPMQRQAVLGACAHEHASSRDLPVLIQGPPGTGKTHVIVSLIAALLNGVDQYGHPVRKRIICTAQTNAAIDHIVDRLVDGSSVHAEVRKCLRGVDVTRIGTDEKIKSGSASERCHVRTKLKEYGVDVEGRENNTYAQNAAYYESKVRDAKAERTKVEAQIRLEVTRLRNRQKSFKDSVPVYSQALVDLEAKKAQLFAIQDAAHAKLKAKLAEEGRIEGSVVVSTPFERVIDRSNVVCGTLSSMAQLVKKPSNAAPRAADSRPYCSVQPFDVVIIDEASQAVEPAALIPLQWIKPDGVIIMVGDSQQLAPTVISRSAQRAYYGYSLFERLSDCGVPTFTLRDQYRMHPDIVKFPSERFYRGLLRSGDGALYEDRVAPWHSFSNCGPYQFFDVKGQMNQDRYETGARSFSNSAEAEFASYCYKKIAVSAQLHKSEVKVGIITPYLDQVRRLRDFVEPLLKKDGALRTWAHVTYGTVDQVQGQEFDAVIISCVRAYLEGDKSAPDPPNTDIGFLRDERRLNVALTRGRYSTWIVGYAEVLKREAVWLDLIENAKTRNVFVEHVKQAPYDEVFTAVPVSATSSRGGDGRAHPIVRHPGVVIQTKNDPRRKAKSEALAKRVVDELAMLDDEPSPLRKPSPAAKHVARRSPVAGRAQQRKQERNRHVAEAKKAPASFVPADELSD